MIVRSPVRDMRPMGRGTQGVRLVNLKSEDRLVATEIVGAEDLEMFGDNGGAEESSDEAPTDGRPGDTEV